MDNGIKILDFNGKKIGTIPVKGEVWFDCDDLANVFGFSLLYDANELPKTMVRSRVGQGIDGFYTIISREGVEKILNDNGGELMLKEFLRFIDKELNSKKEEDNNMENLVIMKNQQAVTSSLQVAETFEKNHQHVLEAIDNLTVENPTVKNMFMEDEYTNSRGRKYRQIIMTRDGFTLLAMGFTGSKAMQFKLKYIDAFNQMEDYIRNESKYAQPEYRLPQTYLEALQDLTSAVEENERLNNKIELDAPKVKYTEEVLDSDLLVTITSIAKMFGRDAQWLNRYLHEKGIIYKQGNLWHLYKPYQNKGYAQVSTGNNHGFCYENTKWTTKGKKFICDLLYADGYYPASVYSQMSEEEVKKMFK